MRIEPFTCTVDGLTLRGSLHAPPGAGPFPAVVLFHGFGGQRMENGRLFVDLARALVALGFVVLAWDRAGHGESDGEFFDTTVTRDVCHARAVIAALAVRDDVDESNLHLVGYSLGAVVAITTAASSERSLRSVTLWSTASIIVDDARAGALLGVPLTELDERGFMDMSGQRLGPALAADVLPFDPYCAAAPYPGAVLLIHGDADFVPVSCATRYADALTTAEVLVVEGADHGWGTVAHRDRLIAATVAHVAAHR